MTNETKDNRITRKIIDEQSLIKDVKEVNLEGISIQLGIGREESERILDKLYEGDQAKKVN